MTQHDLKVWPEFFEDIRSGKKLFELRYNDRDFKVGDILMLEEYDPVHNTYSDRAVCAVITYILEGKDRPVTMGLLPGYCILSLAISGNVDGLREAKKQKQALSQDTPTEPEGGR